MKVTQEQIYGWAGSIGIGVLLALFLLFAVLKSVIPDESEGGVLVNFGYVDEASGMFEPEGNGGVPTGVIASVPPTPSTGPSLSDEGIVTQDIEESVALSDAQRKENEKKAAEERRLKEEERKRREEEQRRQNISNQVAGAFGSSSGSGGIASSSPGTSEGTGTGTGNQGSPQGNSDQGLYSGIGGYGSFSLNGRNVGREGLPRPAYSIPESGVIVVSITVSPKGDVIATSIARGTTIDNASMRKAAMEAAKKAKFNTIEGLNNQTGTITYRFQLN